MIREHLSRILSLPKENIIDESTLKLSNTYMIVNGKIQFVASFEKTRMYYREGSGILIELHKDDLVSLESITLSSGIYRSSKGDIARLTKLPKRQWKKSFSPETYAFRSIFGSMSYHNIIPSSWTEYWKSATGEYYYYDTLIGRTSTLDNKVYCTNKTYLQELKDWIRNEKTKSDSQIQTP